MQCKAYIIIERSITLTTNILVERSALRGAYLSIIFLPILGYKRCNIPLLGAYIIDFLAAARAKAKPSGVGAPPSGPFFCLPQIPYIDKE